jgi:hypothetical protein
MRSRTTPNGTALPPDADPEDLPRPTVVRLAKPTYTTEVLITIQQVGVAGRPRHTSAKVLSFDTRMSPKETAALLAAMAKLLQAYSPTSEKEHSRV